MNVYDRPLFRQAGGPAQPMPQDMGPDAAMLQQAEAGAMAQGEQLGAQYAQQMMQGIDSAQSTEDLINALRGNDRPLDSRRDELAGFVGQADANQTPESVLAMVQPVIMMTEEGMMDSGIGALVQQLVGDVEMTTASGAPTDMGMGVGSLMAAGAQGAPAPQNFRQGGEVAHMNEGGDPAFFRPSEVLTQYEALLPLFQNITSADERAAEAAEQREMDKFQALMSAARGGLRLAAGDPRAGSSFASQVGAAFEPTAAEMAALGAAAQKRRTDLRAEDRALRSAALQGAMGIETAEAQGRQALQLARAKARATAPKNASLEYLYKGDDIKVVNLAEGPSAQDTVDHYISLGYTTEPPETGLGTSRQGRAYDYLNSDTGITALEDYFSGIDTEDSRRAGTAYSIISAPSIDPITRRESKGIVPEHVQAAVVRGQRRLNARRTQTTEATGTASTADAPPVVVGTSPESSSGPTGTFMDDVPPKPEKTKMYSFTELEQIGMEDPTALTGEAAEAYSADLEKATGLPSGPVAFAEYLVAQGADVMNMPLNRSNQGNARTRDARRVLKGIQQRIENFILADQNRPLSDELKRIYDQLPEPSMFTDDEDMYRSIEKWRNYVADEVLFAQEVIQRGEDYAKATETTVSNSQDRRDAAIKKVLPVLNAALASYEQRSGVLSEGQKEQRKPLSTFGSPRGI